MYYAFNFKNMNSANRYYTVQFQDGCVPPVPSTRKEIFYRYVDIQLYASTLYNIVCCPHQASRLNSVDIAHAFPL